MRKKATLGQVKQGELLEVTWRRRQTEAVAGCELESPPGETRTANRRAEPGDGPLKARVGRLFLESANVFLLPLSCRSREKGQGKQGEE